jgi:hypothetical protein
MQKLHHFLHHIQALESSQHYVQSNSIVADYVPKLTMTHWTIHQ